MLDAIKYPHSIQIDKSNKMVYVPNTGADKIFVRSWDAAKGIISTDASNDVDTKRAVAQGILPSIPSFLKFILSMK